MAGELRRDLLGVLLSSFTTYGDVVAYRLGPASGPRMMQRVTVALHHPDAVQRVFTDTDVFTRQTSSYRVLSELFGQNLVTSNGESWLRQKRALQPLFTPRNVQRYADVITTEAQKVIERQRVSPGHVMDTAREMEDYALRVLGHTLFRDDNGIDATTIKALERLVPVVGRQVRSRATQVLRVPLRWPTVRNRQFLETRSQLYATIERVLGQREGLDAEDDLLGRLHADPGSDGPGFSEEEIRDQALIFLLSGHTTTSNALTSTLFLLGRNRDVQEQVSEAAHQPEPDDPEHDLVRAAVQEGMRLYPPSYVIGRHVGVDTELDGWQLDAGTNVLVSPWVSHRHPEFWSRPDAYDPWRFIGRTDRPQYAYFPFGGGARACIGRHFALLEATILVRVLLRAYRLESLDTDVPLAQLISLRPSGPVRIRCHPR